MKKNWSAIFGTAILLCVIFIDIFLRPSISLAASTTFTNRSDFDTGTFSGTEAKSKTGDLKLNPDGTWNARVWRTPDITLTDGSAIATDGTYTYLLVGRDMKFYKYKPTEDKWQSLATPPHMANSGADMVVFGNYIYVGFGGYQKEFSRYSIVDNTWTEMSTLPDLPLSGFSIQADGTDIYALRGNSTTDFWKYHVGTDSWTTLTGPPANISNGADLVFDNSTGTSYLYTPRGAGTNTFYRYNISTNAWSTMATLPGTVNSNGNLTVRSGYIYELVGGNTTTFYKYNISGNSWSTITTTPTATQYVGLLYNATEDLIYVFRGNGTYDWWKYNYGGATFVGNPDLAVAPGTGADLVYYNNLVYYRRGANTTTYYSYNPSTGVYTALTAAPASFNDDTKGVVAGGIIYYQQGGGTSNFYSYNVGSNTWATLATTPATISSGASLTYPGSGDFIYATRGGITGGFYRYSISGNTWSDVAVADLPSGSEAGVGARIVSDGTDVYAITGSSIAKYLKYTVGSDTWSLLGNLPFAPYYGTDMAYYSGKIYALAGNYKDSVWEYKISNDTWRRLSDMSGYYANDIGPYNGASITSNGSGVMYIITGNSISRMMSYTVSSYNFPVNGTWTSDTMDLSYVSSWGSLTSSTTTPGDSAISFESRSSTDKSSWSSWASVSGGTISSPTRRYLQIRATLSATTDRTQSPTLSSFTVNYTADTNAPSNPTSVTGLSQSVGGTSITSGNSYKYVNPYFSFSGATDSETSIAGYYVYFGTNSSADPQVSGNYQTGATYTVTTALSTGTYYLRVKTADAAGNISAATTGFTYIYNGVSPAQSLSKTLSSDFSSGTASNVSTSGDQIKLSSKSGFWQQERLTVIPASTNYGAAFAYVSTTNKLYTFRGNATTFYEYDISTDVWTTKAAAPATVYIGGAVIEGPSGYLYATPANTTNTFWRYDIANNTWSDAAASDAPLAFYYGASFIYDGSRYIYALRGNSDDAFMKYDTQSDSWSLLANTDFGSPTSQPTNIVYVGGDITYDGSNTIYAIQGNGYSGFASYNITSDTWTQMPNLPVLPNNSAQIEYDSTTRSIYYISTWGNPFLYKYSLDTDSWTKLPDAPAAFTAGAALRDVNGVLYALRGSNTTFWKFNIAKNSWRVPNWGIFGPEFRGTDYRPFGYGAQIIKGDGNYYYLTRGNFDNLFVRYNYVTGESVFMADAPVGFYLGSALVYDNVNSKIYAIGTQYDTSLYVYDIATDAWSKVSSDNPPASPGTGSTMVYDGSRYIYWLRGGNTTNFYRYDTQGSAGSRWSSMTAITAAASYGADLILKSGYIYTPRGNNTTTFYRYNISGNSWSTMTSAPAAIYNDGFLVDGGSNTLYACRGINLANCYQYSISGNSWSSITDAPANISQGGAASGDGATRMYVIPGAGGTNTYTNGLYSYIMQSSSSSFQESGSFTSASHDLTAVYKYANINLTYTPAASNTTLTVSTRTSSDNNTWSSWSQASEQKVIGSSYAYAINSTPARYIQVKFEMTSGDGVLSDVIDDYTINYYTDTTAPTNPSTLSAFTTATQSATLTTDTWNNYSAPYFSWPSAEGVGGASDGSTGAGVNGYYVYLGTNSSADPQVSGALQIGTSYTAASLVSGSTYYLRIKTIDAASNAAASVWQPFIYKYDSGGPSNPTTVVADPSGYTNTNSYNFSWSGASDTESSIAEYCYKTGEAGATETCTSSSSVTGITAYQTGSNTFYVRTKDTAGNYSSSYATVSYYYSSTAPGAPTSLTVSPSSNTINEFAFSWSPPATYSGSQAGLRYYYSVNALPTSSNVNTVGLTNAYLTASSYATLPGANVFYVVAKDEAGNIDYSSYASVTFTANTTSPGIPRNLDIADVSIKSTSSWKLALSWDAPTASGSGVANYKVYHSNTTDADCNTDVSKFSLMATTSGKSYVDSDLVQEEHYYCVKACDSTNNCSAVSDTVSLYPDGKWTVAPGLSSGPDVTVKTKSAIVSWSTGRSSNSFVKYGTKSGDYGDEVGSSEQVTDHEIHLTGLNPGTTYYYKALWTDEDGNTGSTDEESFETDPAPFISAVKVTNIGINSAYINFTIKNASKAIIDYGETTNYGLSESISTGTSETEETVPITDLKEGTAYHFRISAQDAEKNSFAGDDYTFETLPVPKIVNLKVQQVIGFPSATIRLLWSSNTPISSIVTYAPVGFPERAKDQISLALAQNHDVILKNLTDETPYDIIVRGKDAAGNEAKADPVSITTAADLRAPVMQNVGVESTISGVGDNAKAQINITWDTDEPGSTQVEYGEGTGTTYGSSTKEDSILSSNHAVTIPGLQPSKIYHLRVVSKDKAKNIGYSDDIVIITPNATKDALNLVVEKLSSTFGFLKNTSLLKK